MTKPSKSNVVKLRQPKSGSTESKEKQLQLAQQKVYAAWEATGKKRTALAKEALEISADCADAYIVLAADAKDRQKRIKLHRQAVEAGQRALGADWEKKYKGIFWVATETRPLLRAMSNLAMDLQCADELSEALELYRKLMKLNPNDNQGVRYQLAGCLYEAKQDKELEKLLSDNADDGSAALLYTKALHLFRKSGASKQAAKALLKAFEANILVPVFLSDIVELPDEPPVTIGFGDASEAAAYVMDNDYLWYDTPGALEWMAEVLAPEMRKAIDDQELVEEALKALKGEYDD